MKVVTVNLGTGNLGSIPNVLRRLGYEATITDQVSEIERADKIILPGVGAFDTVVRNLDERGLRSVLEQKVIRQKTPILGICVGMQLLTSGSEEGVLPGLGWIGGHVHRFRFDSRQAHLKVPHMGWNTVAPSPGSVLFKGMDAAARFYFVHSYFVECENPADIAGTTRYGAEFVSAVERDNVMGIQFHAEKSHQSGQDVVRNFLEYA